MTQKRSKLSCFWEDIKATAGQFAARGLDTAVQNIVVYYFGFGLAVAFICGTAVNLYGGYISNNVFAYRHLLRDPEALPAKVRKLRYARLRMVSGLVGLPLVYLPHLFLGVPFWLTSSAVLVTNTFVLYFGTPYQFYPTLRSMPRHHRWYRIMLYRYLPVTVHGFRLVRRHSVRLIRFSVLNGLVPLALVHAVFKWTRLTASV